MNHSPLPIMLNGATASRTQALAPAIAFRTARIAPVLVVLLLAAAASAQTLTGVVKNATTGKPGAGDEVILITLGNGMEEAGRTKADSKGNFSFKLEQQGPHLVRVIHQEVTYHRMAPPGTTSVEVEVYDVGKSIDGIEVVADIMRFQAQQGQLQVERTFAVQNNSKPPRTQMNEHNLEFYVPDGATVNEGQAMTSGGQPVKSAPVPEGEKSKNKYSFLFPLRPGETRFNVVYTVPYTGSMNIDPKSVYPLQHFVAIAPKSMNFEPAQGAGYNLTNFPGQPDANVEVASNAGLGQPLAFKLSGEGTLAAPADENGQGGGGGMQAQAGANRPGGGLGPPIDAPPPLRQYQWWILGGIAAVLLVGGFFIASRQQSANRAARAKGKALTTMEEDEDTYEPAPVIAARESRLSRPAAQPVTQAVAEPARPRTMLLEGLKEELFELEVEHKQGQISQQEYEKTKAALDQTLQRALKRESQKA
ncbi:MAG: hypothetical protein DMG99_13835 [Acidobacteria bacterium]|nr:MAG: hypothetical protein DMG99_13835 [Acidobacteriota bacterium]